MLKFIKHHSSFLRDVDMSKKSVNLSFSNWDHENSQKIYKDHIGSRFGGSITLVCYVAGMSVLISQIL